MKLLDKLFGYMYCRGSRVYADICDKTAKRNCTAEKGVRFYETARLIAPNASNVIIGADCHIRGEIQCLTPTAGFSLGEYSYIGENTKIWAGDNIRIGRNVLISHNCNIFDNDTHPLRSVTRRRQFEAIIGKNTVTAGEFYSDIPHSPVVIEDDVLICANVTILKGVKIGRGAVIGTGCVITHDVPDGAVVVEPRKNVIVKYVDGEDGL